MEAIEKRHVLWLIIWLALLDLLLLAVAGDCYDKMFDGDVDGENAASATVLVLSLLAGLLLVAAIISGVSHLQHYNSGSVGSACTTALIAWAVMFLTFGLACKEISIGGTNSRTKAVEAFVFMLTFFETIYVGILYGGLYNPRFGVGYT